MGVFNLTGASLGEKMVGRIEQEVGSFPTNRIRFLPVYSPSLFIEAEKLR